MVRIPVPDEHIITVRDLGVGGKGRLHSLHPKDRAEVYFCILYQARIVQTKLGNTKKKASELSPPIPKRVRKATKYKGLSAALIAELGQLASFYSLDYVFTRCEKTKRDEKF